MSCDRQDGGVVEFRRNSGGKGYSGDNDEEEGTELLLYGHLATFQAAVRLNVKELFLC